MSPAAVVARIIATAVMAAAVVAAVVDARPAWIALGAAVAWAFIASA